MRFNSKKKNKLPAIFGVAILVLIVAGAMFVWAKAPHPKSGQYDGFAQCLKDKGVLFYGAFWCPHCQNQKALFGDSAKLLPYIECSTPDGQRRTAICDQNQIKGFPTWVFPDGTRQSGEMSLRDLAEKSSCELPQ